MVGRIENLTMLRARALLESLNSLMAWFQPSERDRTFLMTFVIERSRNTQNAR
jgi:hypothetical protein